jgi:vacuolar-type H+-ATPase subunit I/STV1
VIRNIIWLLFLSISLMGENVDTKTAFETLIIKTGIESMMQDIQREKNITRANTQDIEELKKNVKYLMEQALKQKIIEEEKPSLSIQDDEEMEQLKKENQALKEYIKQIQHNNKLTPPKIQSAINQMVAKVIHEKASLKQTPFQNALVVRYVHYGDLLEIGECDKYGWCKVKGKDEFIPKYKLKFER